ncbi:MAG: RNA-binding transcriptional accessory protein [Flavobacteriales bacterium]|jgi:uncharacterized protein|nr:RNA-binding transcriptional accessory protein [Flavobacteriales bacterium]
MNTADFAKIIGVKETQIKRVEQLIEEGATLPFIARYRKDYTGGITDIELEKIASFLTQKKQFEERKETIFKALKTLNVLTDSLAEELNKSKTIQGLEDLYAPFKPRRKSKVDVAIENGLAPLAKMLMAQNGTAIESIANRYVKNGIKTIDEVLEGTVDIAALWISERVNIKQQLRKLYWRKAVLKTKLVKGKEEAGEKYRDYYDYEERLGRLKSHRFLAIYRAQDEGILKVNIAPEKTEAIEIIERYVLKSNHQDTFLSKAIVKSYSKYFKPTLEAEVRKELKTQFDDEAIVVFANNLKQLLLQAPLGGKRILAIDPGFKSGCKLVCLNENGDLLSNATIYPHPPQKEVTSSKKKVATLIEQYKIEAIALGNGTASRETERFLKSIHYRNDLSIYIVNEAGASVYSASKVAREEFPNYDVTVRGGVSIGRRLIDPLAELVKIDPKSIGVGQYQHDVNQNKLKSKLDYTVENCVNSVGVNLNTASKYLLSYVAGIGPQLAENIIKYRAEHGSFKSRKDLIKVPKLGKKAFEQASGFLRIVEASNPLDNSGVHPENYKLVELIAHEHQTSIVDLIGNASAVNAIQWSNYSTDEVGVHTLADIKKELLQPNRDPRNKLKAFAFAKINSIADIEVGMVLPGIVNNVTNFGAFVDIGIKENGLIHISELADEYVSNPASVIALQQQVQARVINIDKERKRINLSLKSQ